MATLTAARYAQCLDDVTSYYQRTPRHAGPVNTDELPRELLQAAVRPGLRAYDASVQGWIQRMSSDTANLCGDAHSALSRSASRYQQDSDDDAFDSAMNGTGSQAEQSAQQAIHSWRDQAESLYPDAREHALHVYYRTLGYLFSDLLSRLASFIREQLARPGTWLHDHFVAALKDFFTGLMDDMKKFFASL